MISHTTKRFRDALSELPRIVRRQAREAYKLFSQNPCHSSSHFKCIHPAKPVYSVRINIDYRAVGILEDGEIVWFWIGIHAEYDKLSKYLTKH